MTIAGVVVGVLIVVVVAVGQLGGKASGKLQDPGIAYPAALLDGSNIGTADAPVTLEVYEDYQCPVCAQVLARRRALAGQQVRGRRPAADRPPRHRHPRQR